MNNVQAYKRCNVDGEGIITAESGNIRLRLMEISAAGALVAVPKKLIADARYKMQLIFQIRLSNFQFGAEAKITGLREEDGDQYIYEIQFVNLKNEYRVEIDEMINLGIFPEDAYSGLLN